MRLPAAVLGIGDLAVWVMNTDGSGQRRLAPAYGDLSMLPVVSWRPR